MVLYALRQTKKSKKEFCNYHKKKVKRKRDTPKIVVPKGYDLIDLIDTVDSGYGFENEIICTEEMKKTVKKVVKISGKAERTESSTNYQTLSVKKS